jgi:hypothetical protein
MGVTHCGDVPYRGRHGVAKRAHPKSPANPTSTLKTSFVMARSTPSPRSCLLYCWYRNASPGQQRRVRGMRSSSESWLSSVYFPAARLPMILRTPTGFQYVSPQIVCRAEDVLGHRAWHAECSAVLRRPSCTQVQSGPSVRPRRRNSNNCVATKSRYKDEDSSAPAMQMSVSFTPCRRLRRRPRHAAAGARAAHSPWLARTLAAAPVRGCSERPAIVRKWGIRDLRKP